MLSLPIERIHPAEPQGIGIDIEFKVVEP